MPHGLCAAFRKKMDCAVCASVIQSVMPVACKMCFYGRLWEIVGDCAFSKPLKISQKFPKILIIPSSTRPVCVPYSVMLRKKIPCAVCNAFCLHEGIGNRFTVSSPHTPQPFRTHFPSRFSATVSTAVYAGGSVGRPTTASGLYRLRPAGLPGRSFHCTPGLCSVFLSRSQK